MEFLGVIGGVKFGANDYTNLYIIFATAYNDVGLRSPSIWDSATF